MWHAIRSNHINWPCMSRNQCPAAQPACIGLVAVAWPKHARANMFAACARRSTSAVQALPRPLMILGCTCSPCMRRLQRLCRGAAWGAETVWSGHSAVQDATAAVASGWLPFHAAKSNMQHPGLSAPHFVRTAAVEGSERPFYVPPGWGLGRATDWNMWGAISGSHSGWMAVTSCISCQPLGPCWMVWKTSMLGRTLHSTEDL